MLNILTPAELADRMGIDVPRINSVLDRFDKLIDVLEITNPAKPGKSRQVYSARPPLRGLQGQFYRRVLLPGLPPSPYSHGGVPGRSIRTNAEAHAGQNWVFTTDITDFFPSIRHERVRNLFLRLGCSESVAGLCTRLCTYDSRLAQGFVTSPILADRMLYDVDKQIAKAAEELGMVYTRYVDDISVSGPFNIANSGIPQLIRKILRKNGFRVKNEKEQFGSLIDGKVAITNVRVMGNRLDARVEYAKEVERQLQDHASLGRDGEFQGPYYLREQIVGRAQFIAWINPKRVPYLRHLLRQINWDEVRKHAVSRKLIIPARPTIKPARTRQ